MELTSYKVRHYDGEPNGHYGDMSDSLRDVIFSSMNDLLDYINCMCIINSGKSFTLNDVVPFQIIYYTKALLSARLIPSHSVKLTEMPDIPYLIGSSHPHWYFKHKNWITYLSDIKAMPSGISTTTKEESMPDIVFRNRMLVPANEKRVQCKKVTFHISEQYSGKIYKTKSLFSNHEDLFRFISEALNIDRTSMEIRSKSLYIGRFGFDILSGFGYPTHYFSDFNLEPLRDPFYCFVFANSLLDYLIVHNKEQVDFLSSTIRFDGRISSVHIGSEPSCVSLEFSYRTQKHPQNLLRW